MTPARTRRGIAPRVIESWWAPRRVLRDLRGMPEGAMLAVLLAAMAIFLIAQMPGHARAAQLDPSVPLGARMAGALFAVMFLMPLVAYAVAALAAALSRLGCRVLAPADSRLALFWALLAASPAMLLAGLAEGLLGHGPALSLTRAIAGFGFLIIWGAGMAALAGGE